MNKMNKNCAFHKGYSSEEEKQSTINKQNIRFLSSDKCQGENEARIWDFKCQGVWKLEFLVGIARELNTHKECSKRKKWKTAVNAAGGT